MKKPQYWLDPETEIQYVTKSSVSGKGQAQIKARVVQGPPNEKRHPFNPVALCKLQIDLRRSTAGIQRSMKRLESLSVEALSLKRVPRSQATRISRSR